MIIYTLKPSSISPSCTFNNSEKFQPFIDSQFTHSNPTMINYLKNIIKYNSCSNNNYDDIFYPFLSQNFQWETFKSSIKGTGIVITVFDDNVDECILLLNNLQIVKSKLPIQIIYREDELLVDNIEKINKIYGSRMNLKFINVSKYLSIEYSNEFRGYFNKLLAYVFNTFQISIILDTDTVLFQSPENVLINSENFNKHGTLFYKDRNLNYHMSEDFLKFIGNVSPSKLENFWKSEYVKDKYFHYMESGFLAVDRIKFWNSIKLILFLPFFRSTLIASYGDKEMFWLSMILSGYDSNEFYFDNNWTASVGTVDKNEDGKNMICSAHPAHISSETGELIWINSGIKICPRLKNINYEEEIKFWNINSKELEEYYKSNIEIESYIIPPNYNYNIGNKVNEIGMFKTSLCNEYIWCANECVGENCGVYKEFTDNEKMYYNEIINEYYNNLVI